MSGTPGVACALLMRRRTDLCGATMRFGVNCTVLATIVAVSRGALLLQVLRAVEHFERHGVEMPAASASLLRSVHGRSPVRS
jgi:hypothetical protein